jgi:extradiol dioxygenase family protein
MPHLGVVLELEAWEALAQKLKDAHMEFIIPPTIRFEGEVGEQYTMFFTDPSGNPIEVKGFKDLDTVFHA